MVERPGVNSIQLASALSPLLSTKRFPHINMALERTMTGSKSPTSHLLRHIFTVFDWQLSSYTLSRPTSDKGSIVSCRTLRWLQQRHASRPGKRVEKQRERRRRPTLTVAITSLWIFFMAGPQILQNPLLVLVPVLIRNILRSSDPFLKTVLR